jgi:hypothetical protein
MVRSSPKMPRTFMLATEAYAKKLKSSTGPFMLVRWAHAVFAFVGQQESLSLESHCFGFCTRIEKQNDTKSEQAMG